ncbi:hypothetical protein ACLM5H_12640 [Fredinandcohnia humi]
MSATKVNRTKKAGEEHDRPMIGTWISVGVVGVVILATYLLLFGLFMARY